MVPAEHLVRARKRAGAVAIDAFFQGLSRGAKLHPKARPSRHGVEVLTDLRYRPGDDPAHRLDVYRPKEATGPLPVLLHVHGGGFRILSKDTHWMMGLAFARHGLLVVNVNYRLAPKHPFPAAVEDVCAAWAWVLDRAAEHGGDPARVFVAGESAGANLITALTLATCFRRGEPFARATFDRGVVPAGALPFCGMHEVSDIERYTQRDLPAFIKDRMVAVSRGYLGDTPEELRDLADPLRVLEGAALPERALPPFFAPCGTRDPLLDDTRRLAVALERRGVAVMAPEYEGEPHAFHAFLWRENAKRAWRDAYAFVDWVNERRGDA